MAPFILPKGTTINSNLYCTQLSQVDLAIKVRRAQNRFNGRVVFQQDNA
jgi:hypothetical protein